MVTALICAFVGRASAAETISPEEQIRRLQIALAVKTAQIEQLRYQVNQAARKNADVLPAVTPMAAGSETRRTLSIAPTASADARAARGMAEAMAARIPGACVAAVKATGSMRPLFDESALLVLEPVSYNSLRVGDIVTYEHPRTHDLIVHRLLEKRADGFWAKGDHNGKMDDTLVTSENYRMRVCGIIYTGDKNP